jgi:hypothetical protein
MKADILKEFREKFRFEEGRIVGRDRMGGDKRKKFNYHLSGLQEIEAFISFVFDRGFEEGKKAEIVICSAIKLYDRILRGHRHDDIIRNAAEMGYKLKEIAVAEQGFITSKNRFVSREEGLQLQLKAGIKSKNLGIYDKEMLFSEDLY